MPSGLNFPNLFLCNLSKKFQVKRKWSISKVRRRLTRVLLSTVALTTICERFPNSGKRRKENDNNQNHDFPHMELVCLRKTFVNLDNWRKNTIVDYGREGTNENKLKSLQVAKWRKDEWRMNEEWWRMNDEWWRIMISSCWGVLIMNKQMNGRTDICECRVAFATEKLADR